MNIELLGDSGILVRFGNRLNVAHHRKVMGLMTELEKHPFPGFLESVPGFATLAIYYNPLVVSCNDVQDFLDKRVRSVGQETGIRGKVVEVPVRYGGVFGPDLEFVASHNGITAQEVVSIHTGGEYLVYMIGFAPGFPYLGGMSERIATPRLESPRLTIPAGTVGIAGTQTGIYPLETPGGWQLIGRTPLPLFRPCENPPSLLTAGDAVRFRAIDDDEYNMLIEDYDKR